MQKVKVQDEGTGRREKVYQVICTFGAMVFAVPPGQGWRSRWDAALSGWAWGVVLGRAGPGGLGPWPGRDERMAAAPLPLNDSTGMAAAGRGSDWLRPLVESTSWRRTGRAHEHGKEQKKGKGGDRD